MTNYMGIIRLKKIIRNYLVNVKGITEKEFEKKSRFYQSSYCKHKGNEWLECYCYEAEKYVCFDIAKKPQNDYALNRLVQQA